MEIVKSEEIVFLYHNHKELNKKFEEEKRWVAVDDANKLKTKFLIRFNRICQDNKKYYGMEVKRMIGKIIESLSQKQEKVKE